MMEGFAWQQLLLNQIVRQPKGLWKVSVPRHQGKTYMLMELAEYYLERGRPVYIHTPHRNERDSFVEMGCRPLDELEASPNVVVLMDDMERLKYYPGPKVALCGGILVAITRETDLTAFGEERIVAIE